MECELPTFYRHTEPIARKQHKCCECSASINKGEKHFYCAGKWGGDLSEYRQHLDCMEACILIRDEFNDGECVGFGMLFEWLDEGLMWQYNRKGKDKENKDWISLRRLLAKIKWRERKANYDRRTQKTVYSSPVDGQS